MDSEQLFKAFQGFDKHFEPWERKFLTALKMFQWVVLIKNLKLYGPNI